MTSSSTSTKSLKSWLEKSLYLKNGGFTNVLEKFKKSINEHGFTITKEISSEDRVTFEAIYGSRVVALSVGLIPYIGKHLPWGKRFGLKATITNTDKVNVRFNIVPYMELFNTSEALILSQSVDEKASDEYIAARKMYSITNYLKNHFEIEHSEELKEFDNKACFTDVLLGLLIYPLEGYKSAKNIHIPLTAGPRWNWPAFLLPEIWFIWNEIWGVSLLIVGLEIFTAIKLAEYQLQTNFIIAVLLSYRIFLGLMGNRIYYYRYGNYGKKHIKRRKIGV